jgi:hypothetical protein
MGPPDDPRVVRVTDEWDLDDEGIARLTSSGTAATDGDLKLVREHGNERLYDLRSDPLETHPLVSLEETDAVIVGRLRTALAEAENQRQVVRTEQVETPDDEKADLEERLKLLGYL